MAYIQKLDNGKYKAQVERAGVRKSAVWDTKREAEAWARLTETELLAGKKRGDVHTFSEAASRYLVDVTPKKNGARWEELRIPKMIEHFHDAPPLDQIKQDHIAGWRDARLATGVLGSTVRRESKLLHNIFEIARKEWLWITEHPFKDLEMPKDSDPRTAVWRWQQVKRVMRFLGYRTGVGPATKQQEVAYAFLIALHTGLRSAEVLRVNPVSFDPTTRVVQVLRKDGKVSKVPMTKRAARRCVFINAWTIDDAMRDALFRKARDACLVGDLTFHDARASALTWLSRRVDVLTLSRISGHKNLKLLGSTYYRETAAEIAARI